MLRLNPCKRCDPLKKIKINDELKQKSDYEDLFIRVEQSDLSDKDKKLVIDLIKDSWYYSLKALDFFEIDTQEMDFL